MLQLDGTFSLTSTLGAFVRSTLTPFHRCFLVYIMTLNAADRSSFGVDEDQFRSTLVRVVCSLSCNLERECSLWLEGFGVEAPRPST